MPTPIQESPNSRTLTPDQLPNQLEQDIIKLVIEAKDFLLQSNNNHFRSCVFLVEDLITLANQERCTDLVFSHVICNDNNQGRNSTLLAYGFNGNNFILKNGNAFLSAEFDLNFDFTRMRNFDQEINLDWDNDQNPDFNGKIWEPQNNQHLNRWLKQFDAKNSIIRSDQVPNNNGLIRGIYFSIAKLRELGFLNNQQQSRIAIFPITFNTSWRNPWIPDELFVSSYLMAPVNDNNQIVYPNSNNQFLISERSWPHNWTIGIQPIPGSNTP